MSIQLHGKADVDCDLVFSLVLMHPQALPLIRNRFVAWTPSDLQNGIFTLMFVFQMVWKSLQL